MALVPTRIGFGGARGSSAGLHGRGSSSLTVYGFSRPTGDLDVLEIAPRDAGRAMLELGMRGGLLHKKYKIYLDHVGVAHVPEDYEDRLTEISSGNLQTSSALSPRSLRPCLVEAGTQHPT